MGTGWTWASCAYYFFLWTLLYLDWVPRMAVTIFWYLEGDANTQENGSEGTVRSKSGALTYCTCSLIICWISYDAKKENSLVPSMFKSHWAGSSNWGSFVTCRYKHLELYLPNTQQRITKYFFSNQLLLSEMLLFMSYSFYWGIFFLM